MFFHQFVINIVDDVSVKCLKRHLLLNITNFISGLKTLKYWLVEIFIYSKFLFFIFIFIFKRVGVLNKALIFLQYERHISHVCHIIVIIKLNNKGILLSSFTSA